MRKLTICGVPLESFSVVLPPNPPAAVQTAADFLLSSFEKSCGVRLPVTETAEEHGIFVGTGVPCDAVKWDGFRVRTDERSLFLDGNHPRGTLYAAYDFAERFLGYRMFAPDTEVIASDGTADVPPGYDRVDNPSFRERISDWAAYQKDEAFASHSRLVTLSGKFAEAYGGTDAPSWGCHTLASLCPAELYYQDHPEYYALRDGERIPCRDGSGPGQLCLTNPDVLRIVTNNVIKILRADPSRELVEVSQADNQSFCQCEACAAIDREEESHSGTLIRFVNAIAEAVEPEFPKTVIRTFAYQYTSKPPKHTKARKNVLIRYCTIHACFRHAIDDPDCGTNREQVFGEMKQWGSMCDQMSVWDYVINWWCYPAPYPNLISLRENARVFDECKAVSVFEEDASDVNQGGMHPELKAYLIGKVLWNAHMSQEEYDRHIDEFLAAYYGDGWKSIRRIIELEHASTACRCFRDLEPIDFNYITYKVEPEIPWIRGNWRRNYRPLPYQPAVPGHPLAEFLSHSEEIRSLFRVATDAAKTELQREHIRRSKLSFDYVDLFCSPHDRSSMTEEEAAAYEEAADTFLCDFDRYGMAYNLDVWWERKGREEDLS
ncbi:MAG: DUF4838 domain-containing protein [Clostridia bacterium]|nr:DUF4838 domain-containing protein [Clostridia bacterium]